MLFWLLFSCLLVFFVDNRFSDHSISLVLDGNLKTEYYRTCEQDIQSFINCFHEPLRVVSLKSSSIMKSTSSPTTYTPTNTSTASMVVNSPTCLGEFSKQGALYNQPTLTETAGSKPAHTNQEKTVRSVTAKIADPCSACFTRTSMASLSTTVLKTSFLRTSLLRSGSSLMRRRTVIGISLIPLLIEEHPSECHPDDEWILKYKAEISPKLSRKFLARRQQARGRVLSASELKCSHRCRLDCFTASSILHGQLLSF